MSGAFLIFCICFQAEKHREQQLRETTPKFEPMIYSQPVKEFEGSAVRCQPYVYLRLVIRQLIDIVERDQRA